MILNILVSNKWLVIFLLALLILSLTSYSQDNPDEYRKTLEMADNYFARGDYINAKASYQIAVRLAPEDIYPKEKLQLSLEMIKVQMHQNTLYTEKILVADELYRQNDLESAIKVYQAALEILPGDAYAGGRLEEIGKTLHDIKTREDSYQQSITLGDRYIKEGKPEAALAEYKSASLAKPAESYPKDQVALLERMIENQKVLSGDYESVLQAAEQALQRNKFDDAIAFLESAAAIKPEEEFPRQKQEEVRSRKAEYDSYASIIESGDNYYIEKDFLEAQAKYQQALNIKPEDDYPKRMLEKIDIALMDVSKANQSSYDVAIALADKFYNEQDYEQAMVEYKNARRFKPDETYAKQKIDHINQAFNLRKTQEEAYNQSIAKGDNLFKEERYEEAKEEYNRAVGFKSMEQYPKVKIDEINTILANLKNQREIYSSLIKGADKLFFSDNYAEARDQYRKASDLFPKEQYPLDQITMINEILGFRDKYTKSVSRADQLAAERKYEDALLEFRKAAEFDSKEVYPQGRIYEIESLLADQQKLQQIRREYDSVILIADERFRSGEFELAMEVYESATAILPSELYPGRKIEEINRIYAEQAAREALDKAYAEAILEADRLYDVNELERAMQSYQTALEIKSGEQYPLGRIAEIQETLGEQALQVALDKQYEDAISQADRLFANKDYQASLAAYQSALKLKPEEVYAQDRVNMINGILSEMAAKETLENQYADALSYADQLFEVKEYLSAITAYEEALKLKPEDMLPLEKIASIRAILDQIAAKEVTDKQYADAISTGDKLFDAKNYQDAIAAYRNALKLKPGEEFPQNKIDEIQGILLDETARQEALEKQYTDFILNADKLFAIKDYESALSLFHDALKLKSGEEYPQTKIAEIQAILNQIAAKDALDKQYAEIISNGDKLLDSKDFTGAKDAFTSALALRPDDKYAKVRLDEIEKSLVELAKLEEIKKKYYDAVAFAEKHLAANDYENARYEFQVANSIKPDEGYPLEKMEEIDKKLEEIRKQKEMDSQYNKIIAQGDEYFSKQLYEESRARYQEALGIKPREDYPNNQIAHINKNLEVLAQERDQAYQAVIGKADDYLAQQDYHMAKVHYDRALELKPNEVYPLDKLKLVNQEIMKQRQLIQEEYDKAIADADKFYASKIYDNAIDSYRAASVLKPDDEYPKEMVRRILKLLTDRAIVQINREPRLISNNTQAKFDFLPVSVKDRRSNYIFFRARNKSTNEYKLIVNFGKDQTRNGGVVVKVPAGEDLNEFIIRISAQYKWFSDDNNWITFYPEGGDLEVYLVQISYSD